MDSSSYEERIVALDERLQILWKEGSLSRDEYSIRHLKVIELKENLFQERRARTKSRRSLGPKEIELFHKYWRSRIKMLDRLLSLAKKVHKASEGANREGSGWRNTFRLSGLRKILGQMQNIESQMDFENEQAQSLTQSLTQSFNSVFPETQQFSLMQILTFMEALDCELKENQTELQNQEIDLRVRRNHFLRRKELAESEANHKIRESHMLMKTRSVELLDE